MTVATIQGRLLFEGGVYCNIIMIAVANIQKSRQFYSINNSICYILLGTFIDMFS